MEGNAEAAVPESRAESDVRAAALSKFQVFVLAGFGHGYLSPEAVLTIDCIL
jgi:hypothetical protein